MVDKIDVDVNPPDSFVIEERRRRTDYVSWRRGSMGTDLMREKLETGGTKEKRRKREMRDGFKGLAVFGSAFYQSLSFSLSNGISLTKKTRTLTQILEFVLVIEKKMDDSLIDDDFGEIYIDEEVQASCAINSFSTNFATSNTALPKNDVVDEKEEEIECENNTSHGEFDVNLKSESRLQISCSSDEDNESDDSEDDLNIVLNDDDCKALSTANNVVNQDFIEQEEEEEDPSKNGNPCGSSFPSYRKANDSIEVASCSSRYANIKNRGGSLVPYYDGYRFSLPHYRNIFDVDIDSFEDKRWRYPGVDISEFFNFGFNEESWRQYCISMEQLRQHSYMHNRSPNQEFFKRNQACENVPEHESAANETVAVGNQAGSSMKCVDTGEKLMGLPKGRAIQVEDSTVEREPTINLRPPCTWDSDVVIQINLQDSDKNCSGTKKEEFHHINKNVDEKSQRKDVVMDDIKNAHYSGIVSEDEASLKSLEIKRCIQPLSESNQMLLDPDNHVEAIKTVKAGRARVTCKSDQCPTETELSVGDRSQLSLSLSCSESDSEASRDRVESVPEVSGSPFRRLCSGSVHQESALRDNESPKNDDTVRRPVNSRQHLKSRGSIWEGRRHQKSRPRNVAEERTHYDTDSDCSPISDRLSIDLHREVERLHDFGYHSGDDSSYDRDAGFSGRYGVDRFSGDNVKHLHRKTYHQSLGKSQERMNWNAGNFHKRTFCLDDTEAMDRDLAYGGRRLSAKGMVPLTYRESRRLISKNKKFKETDIQWRRKGHRIQYGMKTNGDSCLLNHRNIEVDAMMLKENGRSIPFSSQKRDYLDEKYEGDIPFVGRGNFCGRRIQHDYGPFTDMENSQLMEIEDELCDLDQHSSSWLQREYSTADRGREMNIIPPRYVRQSREICGGKYMDNDWVDGYNDVDNAQDGIIYSDEHLDQKRKYSSRFGVLCQMQDDSKWRHQEDEFNTKRSSCLYEKSSRCERSRAKYAQDCMVVDDVRLEWNRYSMFKGERRVGSLNRNQIMISRGKHEQTARRCSHPVDLILGEGKSSGRCSNAEIPMSNGIAKRACLKFTKEQRTSKNYNGTLTGRAQSGIAKFKGNLTGKRWHKFPVTKQVGHLAVEEGQIVEDVLEKEQASENALVPRNKKPFHSEVDTNKIFDDKQMLEVIAKMEKRKERFKDPIALNREPEKSLNQLVALTADTFESKQKRPDRKRRWGGN
ncbi:FIP1[V]-like protein [Mercurialis annua]|uniref:FIP1[V]-like protein n=1 Tax=Mercurialis annua TaxID=3986 RepID=UPI0024ADA448|nr:FIP1[V]-like protein [Mercurialis annua]